jgi:hypothetical protein
MSFAGCEAPLAQAGQRVHGRMNLAGKAASPPSHVFFSVPRATGSVLVRTHDGRRAMAGGQRIHDAAPDARLPSMNKAIIASGGGTIGLRQIAPTRT